MTPISHVNTRNSCCKTWIHNAQIPLSELHTRFCQTPSKTQTNLQTHMPVCLSVCLFVRYVGQGRPSYGWTKRDASYKWERGGGKNPGSTNKYTKFFGQLIVRKKTLKLFPPDVTF